VAVGEPRFNGGESGVWLIANMADVERSNEHA
jgi:hypothetical protein